ncbi:MAG TPA: hypothetical protein VGN20_18035, partial [Mucilaginibacter sp.]
MKPLISIAMLLIIALSFQSCVPKKKFEELQSRYNKLDSSAIDLRSKYQLCDRNLAIATNRATSLEEQIASEKANSALLQASLVKCLATSGQGNANIAKLVDEISASNKYIQQLINA